MMVEAKCFAKERKYIKQGTYMKEILISIVVVILIISIGAIVQNYLENSSDTLVKELESLKQGLKEERYMANTEQMQKQIEKVIEEWKNIEKTWSMIVVHQELDNIEIALLSVKSTMENNQIGEALKDLDKSIFLVGHIKEKEAFKIKNIF